LTIVKIMGYRVTIFFSAAIAVATTIGIAEAVTDEEEAHAAGARSSVY
jgi:hypothetical protein